MSTDSQIKHLFDLAVEISDPLHQSQFLEIACAGNHELQAEIEELLHHDAAENNPLDAPLVPALLNRFSGLKPGTQIGPYKIREQIGEGGFGEVYVAEQAKPIRRKVALKLIKRGMDSKDIVGRFDAERQALAMMDHPHVAKVLDAGTTDAGQPYFVMELVKGMAITQFCDRHKLTTGERLGLFIDACHAVQHAHHKGIIHRDLKPSNILVAMRDDKPMVKVIDFGVAKALSQPLTELTIYTAFGQMIGTPMYMSPEQAQLDEVDVDTRSDVYGLGVLLYELLTGTTPFDRETLESAGFDEMRRMIREDEPLKPSSQLSTLQMQDLSTIAERRKVDHHKLGRNLQGELDWIVMKALEKDRNRRYESPREFADDIERFLIGQAVLACPPAVTYRLGKFAKRHRGKLTSVALLLVTLCAFGLWQFLQSHRHIQEMGSVLQQLKFEKEASDRASELSLQVAARARKTSYISEMKLAFQRFEEQRLMETSQILADQIPGDGETDLRGVEWHYLNTKLKSQFRVIGTHTAGVQSLDLFPDGKKFVSAGMDGVLAVWDIASGTQLKRFELHHRPIHAVAVSPDGRWIAYGEEDYPHDSHVVIIDAETGDKLARLNHFPYTIRSMDFSGDGNYLVSASAGAEQVNVWEFEEGLNGKTLQLTNTSYGARDVSFADDDKTLIIPDPETRSIGLWDVSQQNLIHHVKNPSGSKPDGFAYNSTQRMAAYAFSRPGQGKNVVRAMLTVVDADSGITLQELESQSWERIGFSPDGTFLFAGSYSGWLESWQMKLSQSGPKRQLNVEEHFKVRIVNGTINTICAPDSDTVLVGGTDGVIALYRMEPTKTNHTFAPDNVRVTNIASSPDSSLFAWLGNDGRVRLTDYRTGQLLDTTDKLPKFAWTLGFSPCGALLAAQCDGRTLQYWDVSSRTLQSNGKIPFGNPSSPHQVAIDRQNIFGFGEEQNNCYVLQTADPTRTPLILPQTFANMIMLSPDGRTLVLARFDLRIYDRETLKLRWHFKDVGNVRSLAISSDNQWLATGHRDGTVSLWDLRAGELRRRLTGHNFAVRAMQFSPDNSRLITGDGGGLIGFWDVASSDCYGLSWEFGNVNDYIREISIGPEERWLDVTVGLKVAQRWTKRIPLRPTETAAHSATLQHTALQDSRGSTPTSVRPDTSLDQEIKIPGQLAYEGFAYPVGKLPPHENSGYGFRKGWTGLSNLTKPSNADVVDPDIEIQVGQFNATGNSILMQGKDTLSRGLATKLDLSQPGDYLVSLLAKRLSTGRPDTANQEDLGVLLMYKETMPVLLFSMSSGRTIFMRLLEQDKVTSQGESPKQDHVADDVAYLLLMYIQVTSDANGQDVARCRVAGIPAAQTLPRGISEVKWSGPALDVPTDITFDRLRITNGQHARYLIDELRIGTTYESVTGVSP